MVLLDAGIGVLTTMNIQHLESLNDQFARSRMYRCAKPFPDWVVKQADEVVLADLPPRALLNRLQRGVIYGREKAQQALDNFFKESTLSALREMALRQAAHEVDVRQGEPDAESSAATGDAVSEAVPAAEPTERILIHITESPATAALIRRGRRVAATTCKAECFAMLHLPERRGRSIQDGARLHPAQLGIRAWLAHRNPYSGRRESRGNSARLHAPQRRDANFSIQAIQGRRTRSWQTEFRDGCRAHGEGPAGHGGGGPPAELSQRPGSDVF